MGDYPAEMTDDRKQPATRRGAPSKFTESIADEICERLAEGQSLRSICRDEKMPDLKTVYNWLHTRPDFFQQYRIARETQADTLFDEILDIADDDSSDTYVDAHGNEQTDNEAVQRSKLRVHARQWMAGKLKPKVYGDKLDLTHGGDPDNPVQYSIKITVD